MYRNIISRGSVNRGAKRKATTKGNDQINSILFLTHSRRLINYVARSILYRCRVFILTTGRRKQNAIYLIGSFDPVNATITKCQLFFFFFFFSRRRNSGINFRGNNNRRALFFLKMCQFAGVWLENFNKRASIVQIYPTDICTAFHSKKNISKKSHEKKAFRKKQKSRKKFQNIFPTL